MARLTFKVLGPIRAWRGDRELELGTPQQRVVLAVLLLHRGRAAAVSELIDALWGEQPPQSAQPALLTYISRLRKVLAEERGALGLIATEPPGYSLRISDEMLDLAVFERLV